MGYSAVKAQETRTTHEGGKAYHEKPELELYRLMASSLMSGDSFYETLDDRLQRFRNLVAEVLSKPGGLKLVAALTKWGREKLYLRTTPTLLATELLLVGPRDYNYGRNAAEWAWTRGDEHLEALAYLDVIGAKRPKRFLRAVAEALNRLTEYQAVKYQRSSRTYSQRDAVKLSHPVPKDEKQSALFQWLLHGTDRRPVYVKDDDGKYAAVGETDGVNLELLPFIAGKATEATWEQIISDRGASKESWEAAIPVMGYMGYLRNLRNFVEHGVSEEALHLVARILADPSKAKQFPYRYYAALKHLPDSAPSFLRDALAEAMDASADNLPRLSGETLLMVDLSGSMNALLSAKSEVTRVEAVAPLAGALARQGGVTTWCFATTAEQAKIPAKTPVLASMQMISAMQNRLGGSTNTGAALNRALSGRSFDRIIVITDGQSFDDPGAVLVKYLDEHKDCTAYHVDVAGEMYNPMPKHPRIHNAAGFSDHVLDWIDAISDPDPLKKVLEYAYPS